MRVDVQETFRNSAEDTKTGGLCPVVEDNPRVSNDGDSLEHWTQDNRKKCNEGECKLFKNVPRICFN